jgi:GAF domain-containing protein
MSGTTTPDRVKTLADELQASMEDTKNLQTFIQRTVQALNNRGVQVLVDFDGLVAEVRAHLDGAQKNANVVSNQLGQLQELVHTSALITSSLDLDVVLIEVIDTVIKLTRAERAYLMLRHGEKLDIRAARDNERHSLDSTQATFSQNIIDTAIKSGTPLITTNAMEDERFQGVKSVMAHDLRSIIIVPLILQGNVVGVLYADNRIEQGVFSQENVPLLTAFANQAAIAISNARLFEKVKDDLEEAQKQVQRLQIVLDQARLQEKVTEITDSDYFQYLTAKAKDLRDRNTRSEEASS